jgi:alginate O-acetyltransferase complex protein AlgI
VVFSSTVFLFLFLPVVLAVYYACPRRARNGILLAASLFFYAWGARVLVVVMLTSIVQNWLFGLWLEGARTVRRKRLILALAIAANLAPLAWFKYSEFIATNLQPLLGWLGWSLAGSPLSKMPIGISFFTFQAMSYVIDVYRGHVPVERSPLRLGLYVALFPQLIAGPIVRYAHVAQELVARRVCLESFASGVERFVVGLAKKLLLANSLAVVADAVFDIPDGGLSLSVAWLGIVCYALQVYFDFSGYSDMAIGLGLMFGFRFQENFNYPYIARSVTDLWRRWHISLSTWFRDYLYIPLGGSHASAWRTHFNLLVVFVLCGLWHGPSWSYLVWGLFNGVFLILERRGLGDWLARHGGPVGHIYTMLVWFVGLVIFRSVGLEHAGLMLQSLAGFTTLTNAAYPVEIFLDPGLCGVLAIACLAATPLWPLFRDWLSRQERQFAQGALAPAWCLVQATGRLAAVGVLLVASAVMLSASTYNPFIYFQF